MHRRNITTYLAQKVNNIKGFYNLFQVPDLIDYIKVKKELEDLRKDIKIWTRRTHLQKVPSYI